MKKWTLLCVVTLGLLAGCQKKQEEILDSTSTETSSSMSSEISSNETRNVAKYYGETSNFAGEWECIDPDAGGERVTISAVPDSNGLVITYEGEEATTIILTELDVDKKLWRFHNEESEMNYTIIDGDSGVITLYRATTAEGAVGTSKPMEYQKIT